MPGSTRTRTRTRALILVLALTRSLTFSDGLDLLRAHGEAQRGEGLVQPEERGREPEEHRRPAAGANARMTNARTNAPMHV